MIAALTPGAAAHCLRPGSTTVGSAGHGRYCIDVNSSVNDGAKLVVQLEMPRALDVVRIGSTTLLHSPRNTSSHGGAIIEASTAEAGCDVCDECACVGCGATCGACVCVICAQASQLCTLTAGVVAGGRWHLNIDAPAVYTLRSTLVGPMRLDARSSVTRSLLAADAPVDSPAQLADAQQLADGTASVDYFYVDEASPQEVLTIHAAVTRAGSPRGYVDVYIRSSTWPTTLEHDAMLSTDPRLSSGSRVSFGVRADRLIAEPIYVMVVARGGTWVSYAVRLDAGPSLLFWVVIGLATAAIALAVAVRCGAARGKAERLEALLGA